MMIFIFPVLYIGWKLIWKTKYKKPHEVDLQEDLEEIEEYTRNYVEVDDQNRFNRWMDKIFG
jgi:amino acid transporter